jgi:hypothetical protein
MGKKIVRLTEQDLMNIVKRVIGQKSDSTTDYNKMVDELLRKGPKPTESGAKYCFSRNDLVNQLKNIDIDDFELYKIKPGDGLSKLNSLTQQTDLMYKLNRLCNLKDKNGLKVNDVVILSNRIAQGGGN